MNTFTLTANEKIEVIVKFRGMSVPKIESAYTYTSGTDKFTFRSGKKAFSYIISNSTVSDEVANAVIAAWQNAVVNKGTKTLEESIQSLSI